MPSFRTGRVTGLVSVRPGLQRVEVDGEPAYVLVDLTGPVREGDRVVVNTTAVDLGLGTGGSHVVHWNLERQDWRRPGAGHLIKLRYTPVQADVGAWTELAESPAAGPDEVPALPDLTGLVVVVATLHSLLAPISAAVAAGREGTTVAWVMDDTAALPCALSELADRLRTAGLVHLTVSCGQAFGGDREAVSVLDGLVAAASAGAQVAVLVPGPGLAGTASTVGFGAVAAAGHADAAAALGASTGMAVRASRHDARARHRGVSHHTTTVLALAARGHTVPVPQGPVGKELVGLLGDVSPHEVVEVPTPDVAAVVGGEPLAVRSMGRPLAEDDLALGAAAAAGAWAGTLASA